MDARPRGAGTVAVNVAYGLPHGVLAALVSSWPGISFVGSAELLLRGRAARVSGEVVGESQETVPEVPVQPGPDVSPDTAADTRTEPPGTSRGTQRPKTVPAARRDLATVFAADLAARKVPGIREIKDRMQCGQPIATSVQRQLRQMLGAQAVPEPLGQVAHGVT